MRDLDIVFVLINHGVKSKDLTMTPEGAAQRNDGLGKQSGTDLFVA